MKTYMWLLCLCSPLNGVAGVFYVDVNNPSPVPPYTSWDTAAVSIQDAVDVAGAGDVVLVADGVYAVGGRPISANLTNRVVIDKVLTVQSVNGPESTVIQGYQVPGTTNGDEAVRCVYLGSGASLVGFTLTQGATLGRPPTYPGPDQDGGGIYCLTTNCIVSNCVVTGNSSSWYGGGAYQGTFVGCTLSGNSAFIGGGAWGCSLSNCALISNSAVYSGGAERCTLSHCLVANNVAAVYGGGAGGCVAGFCELTGNSAQSGGGAAWGVLSNCTLTANYAYQDGGGSFKSTLRNCALSRNRAEGTGGGAGGYDSYVVNSTLTGNSARTGGGADGPNLLNCIVYYNTAISGANVGEGYLRNCCTTPSAVGFGNIAVEPNLASVSHLSASSPCRGAGNAAFTWGTDIDGETWSNPPSIGCDEYHVGAVTGALTAAIDVPSTNVAVGFPATFTAAIDGRTTASTWDLGEDVKLTNRPYATRTWTQPGDYPVKLTAFNESNPAGVTASVVMHVTNPIHYVAANSSNPVAPYDSWATAAATIQDAVDAAVVPGALVLVTNGIYHAGGRAVFGTLTNRVAVTKPVTLRSVNGPEFTVIQGRQVPGTINGDGAVRCVYLGTGAGLIGFTLTHGATALGGFGALQLELSGGGLYCEPAILIVSNCLLAGNSASALGGGG